jgi:hypothetical protein
LIWELRRDAHVAGSAGLPLIAQNLSQNYVSHDAHVAGAGYRNSTRHYGSRGMGIVSADLGAQADFASIGSVQRLNAAREVTTSAFVDEGAQIVSSDVSVPSADLASNPGPQLSSLSKSRRGW